MLWWAITPFLIACGATLALFVVALLATRARGIRTAYATLMAGLLSAVAFVPICFAAYFAISPFRFGEFSAANFEAVRFSRVQAYLPESASNITMVNTLHHHHVRFHVAEDELNSWMVSLWESQGRRSPMARDEAALAEKTVWDDDDATLRRLGLKSGGEYLLYQGPYQEDWGGPTLWYHPESETAWQYVGYW